LKRRAKGIFCLTAALVAADQEDDDETSTPEPQPGIQGKGGVGCLKGEKTLVSGGNNSIRACQNKSPHMKSTAL